MAVEQAGHREIPISELTYFPGNARRGNLTEIRKSVRRPGAKLPRRPPRP